MLRWRRKAVLAHRVVQLVEGDRVNTNKGAQVRDWSKYFGCTSDQLQLAVKEVGGTMKDVRDYLRLQRWTNR